ncbi:hypothetical protein [Sphingomonas sp.]|uniref:hypothetical protein n=1 Tax=Sphingomonas sp. TaxID=28214 RepID=UPI003D6CC5DC
MKMRALYLTSLLPLALAACQLAANIEVSGTVSAAVFIIQEEGLLWSGPATFDELAVVSAADGHQWRMTAKNNCAEKAPRIVYGQIPAGFTADRPAPALKEGRSYDVFVSGCGRIGKASFRIIGGRVVSI